jgi:glyoxylase-like metal-dependent hydrolase (beta-lactamase superfamily II)
LELEEFRIGAVTVLLGARGGKYPDGNALLVEGTHERLVIDPSLGLRARTAFRARVDRVLNSHCHEDHVAGNSLYPDVPWHLHEADLHAIQSLDAMVGIYGLSEPAATAFRGLLVETFHFTPRTDAVPFKDGDVFDLGGVRVRAIRAPGHTPGHCVFHIEQPDDLLFLADIDFSGFGPYYGDAESNLDDFERSLAVLRKIEARGYVTSHKPMLIRERAEFLERIDRYAAVIVDRDRRLLAYLSEPHSMDEIVAHRFIYRPEDEISYADDAERRHMVQHLERMLRDGRVREVAAGRYLARAS